MTAEQFTYWLQGFVELTDNERPSAAQWQAIGDHLQTVFNKVTPQRITSHQGGFTTTPGQSISTLESRVAHPGISGITTAIC